MTMVETETIACPACKKKQAVDVYQTINAMENPELVQKLMAGEISVLTCTACGHVAQDSYSAIVQRSPDGFEDTVLPGTLAGGKSRICR